MYGKNVQIWMSHGFNVGMAWPASIPLTILTKIATILRK